MSENGEDCALIGIEEANTEVVGTNLAFFVNGDERVGGKGAKVGDFASVEHGSCGDAQTGSAGANDADNLVLRDQAAGCVDHIFVTGAAIVHDDFHGKHLSADLDTAGLVDLVDCDLDRFSFSDAVSGKVAGDGCNFADANLLSGECREREHQYCQDYCKNLLHCDSPL